MSNVSERVAGLGILPSHRRLGEGVCRFGQELAGSILEVLIEKGQRVGIDDLVRPPRVDPNGATEDVAVHEETQVGEMPMVGPGDRDLVNRAGRPSDEVVGPPLNEHRQFSRYPPAGLRSVTWLLVVGVMHQHDRA